MSVAVDVARYLEAREAGSAVAGAADWLIRASRLSAERQPQIAVLAAGGAPERLAHDGSGARYPVVQIRIRGAPGAYEAAAAKAGEVLALLAVGRHLMNGRAYQVLERGGPRPVGYGAEQDRPELSLPFRLGVVEEGGP